MPELPEVETIVRELRTEGLCGQSIQEVIVSWAKSIAKPELTRFCESVSGQIVRKIERRGKFLVFSLTHGYLLCHLRMTGRFSLETSTQPTLPFERVRFIFMDGRVLIFSDTRKFGRLYWVADKEKILGKLGVEPTGDEFTVQLLVQRLQARQRALKPLLLDQSIIAGLGNIYVDEALWEAQLHPLQPAGELSFKQIKRLHKAIIIVLERGIDHLGTSLGAGQTNYFSVSGRQGGNQYQLRVFRCEGQPCPRCASTIIKLRVAQRGTHLCPSCQTKL